MVNHHLQGGGHDEQARCSALFDAIKHRIWRKFSLHQRRQTRRQRHNAKPGPANMRAGHGDEDNLIIIPLAIGMFFFSRIFAQGKQIAVGEHRTLGITRGA